MLSCSDVLWWNVICSPKCKLIMTWSFSVIRLLLPSTFSFYLFLLRYCCVWIININNIRSLLNIFDVNAFNFLCIFSLAAGSTCSIFDESRMQFFKCWLIYCLCCLVFNVKVFFLVSIYHVFSSVHFGSRL